MTMTTQMPLLAIEELYAAYGLSRVLFGVSLNVEPDLDHFSGIVPCGVTEHGVTSLVDLGLPVTLDEADAALRLGFERVFGATIAASPPS